MATVWQQQVVEWLSSANLQYSPFSLPCSDQTVAERLGFHFSPLSSPKNTGRTRNVTKLVQKDCDTGSLPG
jgi:hypothetical protein